jgi:hypothetical protein
MDELVTIATHYSLAEAEPERLALEAAGIPTVASDESVGTLLTATMVGGIKLQVAPADAARAEEILDELRAESNPPEAENGEDEGVSFACPECKAEIWFPSDRRGHVEECPECGAHVDVPGNQ